MSQVALPPDANDLIDLPQAADLTGKYQQLGHTGGSRQNQNQNEPQAQEASVRKKKKKEIIQLPKMKIIVKSTKTISFDGQYDSNDESESDQDGQNHNSGAQQIKMPSSAKPHLKKSQEVSKPVAVVAEEGPIAIADEEFSSSQDKVSPDEEEEKPPSELSAVREEEDSVAVN